MEKKVIVLILVLIILAIAVGVLFYFFIGGFGLNESVTPLSSPREIGSVSLGDLELVVG